MSSPETLLARASHGVALWWAEHELQSLSGAVWWDGAALWCNPESSPQLDNGQAVTMLLTVSDQVICVQGSARVYGLRDPFALALHAPMLTTAMGALALRGGVSLGSLRHPGGIAVRVVADATEVLAPHAGAPIAASPGLPVALPADLRRALAGVRDVALLQPGRDTAMVQWATGYALHGVPAGALQAGPAAVAVQRDTSLLVITGTLLPGPRLAPAQARWWHDTQSGESDMSTVRSAMVLPD